MRGPHVSPPPPEKPRTLHETFQDGWTAAMRAAQYGHVNILRYFLDTGASKDSRAHVKRKPHGGPIFRSCLRRLVSKIGSSSAIGMMEIVRQTKSQ